MITTSSLPKFEKIMAMIENALLVGNTDKHSSPKNSNIDLGNGEQLLSHSNSLFCHFDSELENKNKKH